MIDPLFSFFFPHSPPSFSFSDEKVEEYSKNNPSTELLEFQPRLHYRKDEAKGSRLKRSRRKSNKGKNRTRSFGPTAQITLSLLLFRPGFVRQVAETGYRISRSSLMQVPGKRETLRGNGLLNGKFELRIIEIELYHIHPSRSK